jgi:hypothetical protein
MQKTGQKSDEQVVHLPAPTAWPMVLALGIALVFASMVTNVAIGVLGLVLLLRGAFGWFSQVLPHEALEAVTIQAEDIRIVSTRTMQERLPTGAMHRKVLPVQSFSIMAGIRGGLAGGAAMTVPAALYGLLKYHSIWYAMNLLAAGGFVSWAGASNAFLCEFHLRGLLAALAIHTVTSVLVGLLYGAVLPMFPKLPILTAGILVPLFFTGLLYSALGVISPILNQRIDWFWFVASQIAFGLVCGFVVNLHEKVRTPQFRSLPFALRAGIHGDKRERASDEDDTQ